MKCYWKALMIGFNLLVMKHENSKQVKREVTIDTILCLPLVCMKNKKIKISNLSSKIPKNFPFNLGSEECQDIT